MNKKKCAVFSCLGLGDGLITLVLSHNLHENGAHVVTFHPSMKGLQNWFPHLPISPFPELDTLNSFDEFYIIYEKSPWMHKVLEYLQKNYPEKTRILNPIATLNTNYPYWEEGKFQGNLPFAKNLYLYCNNSLKLPNSQVGNGVVIPNGVTPRKFPNRIVIHPTSSRPGKNWPKEKFLSLAKKLKEKGFEPVLILSPNEKREWPKIDAPLFSSLSDLAAFVCESGYMIGNDSGIGHLASCLGLPTIIICRSAVNGAFWRPGWTKGQVLCPSPLIPNLKGLRLRDKYWKKWISVNRVYKAFLDQE